MQRQVEAGHEVLAVDLLGDVVGEHRQAVGAHVLVTTHLLEVIEHRIDATALGEHAVSHGGTVVQNGAEAHKMYSSQIELDCSRKPRPQMLII